MIPTKQAGFISRIDTPDSAGDSSVKTVDPVADSTWASQVVPLLESTFFHDTPWARVLSKTYGFRPVYFYVRRPSGGVAAIPFFEIDSFLTGRRGVSLPFTDECAPLARNAEDFRVLFEEILRYAKQHKWEYIELRGGKALLGDVPASTSYFGHELDLQAGEAALFDRCSPATRRAVRKGEQASLTVETTDSLETLTDFYRLFCRTRRRQGLPIQPFKFFAEIHRQILVKGLGCVTIARRGTVPIAGAVFFHFRKTSLYKFGASDLRFQHFRANNLVIWEAIKHHANRGFMTLNFGRTSIANTGLRRFKLGWGCTEYCIDYVRMDVRSEKFVQIPDGAFGWYNRVFSLLPVSFSRLAGAMLYKHAA